MNDKKKNEKQPHVLTPWPFTWCQTPKILAGHYFQLRSLESYGEYVVTSICLMPDGVLTFAL
jgi:hypothetical protein